MYALNATAGAPSRSNGSFTLSWGLITIPLSTFSGSEDVRVVRKEFVDGDPTRPVGRIVSDKNADTAIDPSHVIRMAEADTGAWVVLTDDEIAACSMPKGVAEIITFVKREWLFEYLPEDVLQVRPPATKGKQNPAQVKAFSLLLSAMLEEDVSALIKYAGRTGVRYGLLTYNGDLISVKTSDQIRARLPLDVVTLSDQERDLAKQLIASVGTSPVPIFNDTAAKVQEYVNTKATGVTPTAVAVVPASSDDILAMLQASLAAQKA